MDARQRFLVPPGWPAQTRGWVPPPGWCPDPAWPAPPFGWRFWVPDRSPQDAQALGVVISMPLLMLVFGAVSGAGGGVLPVWSWVFAVVMLLLALGAAHDRRWVGLRNQIRKGTLIGCCVIPVVALMSFVGFA